MRDAFEDRTEVRLAHVRHGAQTRHEIPFALFPPKLAGDLEAHGSGPCPPTLPFRSRCNHETQERSMP